tara:strand:- start:3323 stop:4060 length:738 start_codon:yes stop_codon:yes gene_type:complete
MKDLKLTIKEYSGALVYMLDDKPLNLPTRSSKRSKAFNAVVRSKNRKEYKVSTQLRIEMLDNAHGDQPRFDAQLLVPIYGVDVWVSLYRIQESGAKIFVPAGFVLSSNSSNKSVNHTSESGKFASFAELFPNYPSNQEVDLLCDPMIELANRIPEALFNYNNGEPYISFPDTALMLMQLHGEMDSDCNICYTGTISTNRKLHKTSDYLTVGEALEALSKLYMDIFNKSDDLFREFERQLSGKRPR